MSSFYRYAEGEDAITRNPVTHVRRPKVGTDTVSTGLDADEMTALIHDAAADSPRSHALVLLLGMNGLRITEVLDADVDDLTTERGHRVLLITRKGGKKATVPMAPRTAEAVDAYVGDRVTGPLFVTANGKRWQRSEVWRTLRRLARVAVPGKATTIHPHDLRHAFVTLSLDAGASLRDVQDAAGHADRELPDDMTERGTTSIGTRLTWWRGCWGELCRFGACKNAAPGYWSGVKSSALSERERKERSGYRPPRDV